MSPGAAEAVRLTAARLRAAGVASPEADARVLTAHTLGIEPKDLMLARPLTDAEIEL
ncbi:MAG: peptide chain release factor N(5)-glutamine methyltransferase, partial [Propionibacteriaceae bacterium]|nr:peptide chain release factor N(5)-glutamine methyltransferase [Propionibacteriaceae bacterium]